MRIKSVELRFIQLAVLLDLGIESLQRFKIQALVRVIESFTKVQVLQFLGMNGPRCQSTDQQDSEHE